AEIEHPTQRSVLKVFDSAMLAIQHDETPTIGRIWLEACKAFGKDLLLSISIAWVMTFTDRELTIRVGASDRQQADELRKSLNTTLRLNDWLASFLEIQNFAIVNRTTGSRCEIIAADEAGAHGSRPDLSVLNELCHHASSGFADTMADDAAKVRNSVLITAT